MTRDERLRWLDADVLNPIEKLLNALSENNAPKLSQWPEKLNAPEPNKPTLIGELEKLFEWAGELWADLNDRKSDRSTLLTEFKTNLVNALSYVFETHFPNVPAARDSWDRTGEAKSPYVEYLNLCVREIFPSLKSAPGRVADDISKYRGNR